MPVPWASTDEGECWIWGDYFFLVLQEPPTLDELFSSTDGNIQRGNLSYPLALVGFYKADKNPFAPTDNPTGRPLIALTIEQVDFVSALSEHGLSQGLAQIPGIGTDGKGPLILGHFHNKGRDNLGPYDGSVTRDEMRKRLFDLVPAYLPVHGEPIQIGTIRDAMGHPSTGLPTDFMGGITPIFSPKVDSKPARKVCSEEQTKKLWAKACIVTATALYATGFVAAAIQEESISAGYKIAAWLAAGLACIAYSVCIWKMRDENPLRYLNVTGIASELAMVYIGAPMLILFLAGIVLVGKLILAG